MDILMSIKTKYVKQIFNGTKMFEYRRKSIGDKNLNKKVYIYSSEEDKAIVGYVIFDKIIGDKVDVVLKETGVTNIQSMVNYFKNKDIGYALHIKEYHEFKEKIKLEDLKKIAKDFVVPQFYRYISDKEVLSKMLDNKELVKVHNMKLQAQYFDWIKKGTKRIELRLNDEKRQKIRIGDEIIFEKVDKDPQYLKTKVVDLDYEDNFNELIDKFDIDLLADKQVKKEELLSILNEIYPLEKQKKYGVVGIKIEIKEN